MLFGTLEMLYSAFMYFGSRPLEFDEDPRIKTYELNTLIFGVALAMEFMYWVISRLILTVLYLKSYMKIEGRSCFHNFTVIITHTLVTILPCEMLLFFGYHRSSHVTDFERGLLNLSWMRRIVSAIRILTLMGVQIMSSNFVLADDFVSTVFLFQTVYLAMTIIAIFP